MKARVVIGANFGDEGKGIVTDYLCAKQGAGIVVRYNGGAQAGHTVCTGNLRHVFSHYGSGSFAGVPTFLSQFFIVNPILFFKERTALNAMGVDPTVVAHPACLVTTFADMIINQRLENARGAARHGSVGVGINETQIRSSLAELRITLGDLWNGVALEEKLKLICTRYALFRTGDIIENADVMIENFIKGCREFADAVNPFGIQSCQDPIFEGAQGLLLDQDRAEFFPHVTHSKTGMHNVRILCAQAGIDDIETYYVTRTYLTRHGAGALPDEDASMSFEDNTNVPHDYQGSLRFAPLNFVSLALRCAEDAKGPFKVAFTHLDQTPSGTISRKAIDLLGDIKTYGPDRKDVESK